MAFSSAVKRKEKVKNKYYDEDNVAHEHIELRTSGKDGSTLNLEPFKEFLFNAPNIGKDNSEHAVQYFVEMFKEHPTYALRMALWLRDVRGGAGRRAAFRHILQFLDGSNLVPRMNQFMLAIPEVGRYDDLISFASKDRSLAFEILGAALKDEHKRGLVAKWLPREHSNRKTHRNFARQFGSWLGMTPREYRKMLAEYTNVVEQQMCANNWNEIEYEKLPSQASGRYAKAFERHSPKRYAAYLSKVESGDFEIKSTVSLPHEILQVARNGGERTADAKWKALPVYSDKKVLPLIDVSGSMTNESNTKGYTNMDLSIMLGIYFSEKNTSELKDVYLTFSSHPKICQMSSKSIMERYNEVKRSNWSMTTDLDLAFKGLLKFAIENKLKSEDMPDYLIVLSDMQFNGDMFHWGPSLAEKIQATYNKAGYPMPSLVWWNLDSLYTPSIPSITNTYLVSGSSPNIIKNVLSDTNVTTEDVIMSIVEGERYKSLY